MPNVVSKRLDLELAQILKSALGLSGRGINQVGILTLCEKFCR